MKYTRKEIDTLAYDATCAALDVIDKFTGIQPTSRGPLGDALATKIDTAIKAAIIEYDEERP